MSLFKFENGDIIRNTIVSYPKNKFLFHSGSVIYNDSVQESGTDWDNDGEENLTKFIPPGHISLYEMNIDRPSGSDDIDMIRPFVYTTTGYKYGSYPLSSSIYPRYINSTSGSDGITIDDGNVDEKRMAQSLENTINYYKYMSKWFDSNKLYADDFNLVSIPSVFYGNKIKPGSVKLELIVTGSQKDNIVIDDLKNNGELADPSGEVHGVVLYNEGFIILRSGTELSQYESAKPDDHPPRWIDFGMLTEQRTNYAWTIEFEGVTETPVVTMFAHARKNELNHSNNPSWLQTRLPETSSSPQTYTELNEKEIKNITKTDLIEEDPLFKKETYISKIAIYDEDKKIIGYAKLARPIRKTEEREFTFKLKLDL